MGDGLFRELLEEPFDAPGWDESPLVMPGRAAIMGTRGELETAEALLKPLPEVGRP